MKNIKRKMYLYVSLNDFGGGFSYTVSTGDNMESVGWLLIDTKEVDFEFEDKDYTDILKQNKVDAVLAQQEKLSAELLELTS